MSLRSIFAWIFLSFPEVREAHDPGDAALRHREHEDDVFDFRIVQPNGLTNRLRALGSGRDLAGYDVEVALSGGRSVDESFGIGSEIEYFAANFSSDAVWAEVEPEQLAVPESIGNGIDDLEADG